MEEPRDEMVTIFRSSGVTAESEAEMIHGLLESNGVQSILTGLDVLPGAHEVVIHVPVDQQARAEQLIADAQQGGPAAADEAELASEEQP